LSLFQHKRRYSEQARKSWLEFKISIPFFISAGEPGLDVYVILKGEVRLLVYNESLVGDGIEISSPEEKEFLKLNYPLQTVTL